MVLSSRHNNCKINLIHFTCVSAICYNLHSTAAIYHYFARLMTLSLLSHNGHMAKTSQAYTIYSKTSVSQNLLQRSLHSQKVSLKHGSLHAQVVVVTRIISMCYCVLYMAYLDPEAV